MNIRHTIFFIAIVAIISGLYSCTFATGDEGKLNGSWKCTTLLVNGGEILGLDSSTTNLINTYNLNGAGQTSSDAGTNFFTWEVANNTLTYFSSTDTIVHSIDTLTDTRLRISTTIDTVTYDGGYTKL